MKRLATITSILLLLGLGFFGESLSGIRIARRAEGRVYYPADSATVVRDGAFTYITAGDWASTPSSANTEMPLALAKVNVEPRLVWYHQFSTAGDDEFIGADRASDGTVVVLWNRSIAKLYSDGTVAWQDSVAGDGALTSVSITPAGDILIGGYYVQRLSIGNEFDITAIDPAENNRKAVVIKLDANGQYAAFAETSGPSDLTVTALNFSQDGYAYIVGVMGPQGAQNVFVQRLNTANGRPIFTRASTLSGGNFLPRGVDVDEAGSALISMAYQGTVRLPWRAGRDSTFAAPTAGSYQPLAWNLDRSGNSRWLLQARGTGGGNFSDAAFASYGSPGLTGKWTVAGQSFGSGWFIDGRGDSTAYAGNRNGARFLGRVDSAGSTILVRADGYGLNAGVIMDSYGHSWSAGFVFRDSTGQDKDALLAEYDWDGKFLNRYVSNVNGDQQVVSILRRGTSIWVVYRFTDRLQLPGKLIGSNGGWDIVVARFDIGGTTSVSEQGGSVPAEFVLSQNYPNPFNPTTTISYDVPSGKGELTIFNLAGQVVRVFRDLTGNGKIEWDGKDQFGLTVATGIYVYRMRVGDAVLTRQMMFLK